MESALGRGYVRPPLGTTTAAPTAGNLGLHFGVFEVVLAL